MSDALSNFQQSPKRKIQIGFFFSFQKVKDGVYIGNKSLDSGICWFNVRIVWDRICSGIEFQFPIISTRIIEFYCHTSSQVPASVRTVKPPPASRLKNNMHGSITESLRSCSSKFLREILSQLSLSQLSFSQLNLLRISLSRPSYNRAFPKRPSLYNQVSYN